MPDLGEAYGDENVPSDPYDEGLLHQAAERARAEARAEIAAGESEAEPAIEDNPDPEYDNDPLGGYSVEDAAIMAALDLIQEIKPGVVGMGQEVVRLRNILLAWYTFGAESK